MDVTGEHMSEKNECSTYFVIKGEFDPNDITRILTLMPTRQWRSEDLRPDGTAYGFSLWECGRCNKYDVFTENQMMRTIKQLVPKIHLLQEIKKKYNVTFVLEIVPSIFTRESTPCLAPNRAVIEFCYLTETEIDIDLYVNDHTRPKQ